MKLLFLDVLKPGREICITMKVKNALFIRSEIMAEWKEFDGSDEQIAEMGNSRAGWIVE